MGDQTKGSVETSQALINSVGNRHLSEIDRHVTFGKAAGFPSRNSRIHMMSSLYADHCLCSGNDIWLLETAGFLREHLLRDNKPGKKKENTEENCKIYHYCRTCQTFHNPIINDKLLKYKANMFQMGKWKLLIRSHLYTRALVNLESVCM